MDNEMKKASAINRPIIKAMKDMVDQNKADWPLVTEPPNPDREAALNFLADEGQKCDRIIAGALETSSIMTSKDKTALALISCKLLRGLVDDATLLAQQLTDPNVGLSKIEDWKLRYAGFPHGQWAG